MSMISDLEGDAEDAACRACAAVELAFREKVEWAIANGSLAPRRPDGYDWFWNVLPYHDMFRYSGVRSIDEIEVSVQGDEDAVEVESTRRLPAFPPAEPILEPPDRPPQIVVAALPTIARLSGFGPAKGRDEDDENTVQAGFGTHVSWLRFSLDGHPLALISN